MITDQEAQRKFVEFCAIGFEHFHITADPGSTNMTLAEVFGWAYVQMRQLEFLEKVKEQEDRIKALPWWVRWIYR